MDEKKEELIDRMLDDLAYYFAGLADSSFDELKASCYLEALYRDKIKFIEQYDEDEQEFIQFYKNLSDKDKLIDEVIQEYIELDKLNRDE